MGELTEGGQANIYRALDTQNNKEVVLKIYNDVAINQRKRGSAQLERDIMMSVPHQYLHKCLDYYEDETMFVLVTELLVCDLCDLIIEVKRPLTESATRSIFRNLLLAVSTLHD